jgi:hypothetical protein
MNSQKNGSEIWSSLLHNSLIWNLESISIIILYFNFFFRINSAPQVPDQKITWPILIECLNRTIKIVNAYIKYSSDMNTLIVNCNHTNIASRTNDNMQKNSNKFTYQYGNNRQQSIGLQNNHPASKHYSNHNNNINSNYYDKFSGQNFQPDSSSFNQASNSNSNLFNSTGANNNDPFSNKMTNNSRAPLLVGMGSQSHANKMNFNSINHNQQQQQFYSNNKNFNYNNQRNFQNNSNTMSKNFPNYSSPSNNSNISPYRTNSSNGNFNSNYHQQEPAKNPGLYSANGHYSNKFRNGGGSGNSFNFDG